MRQPMLTVISAVVACVAATADAAVVTVRAEPGALAAAIARAAPGDTLVLETGVHDGPVVIDRPLAIEGAETAVVDGQGETSTITLTAPDVVVRGLTVRNSGRDMFEMNAGIFVTEEADRALIDGVVLENNLFGVLLQGPEDAIVRDSTIVGQTDARVNERGNGVQIWRAPGSQVLNTSFRYGRDGIFVTNSHDNRFVGNRFTDLRFAVHYMYTHDSEVSGNVSEGNHIGFALMFSDRLVVRGNRSIGDRDQGFQFNFTNDTLLAENEVVGTGDRCVFVYNAHRNRISGNRISDCGVGIHYTAGSERNLVFGNAFIGSRTQVKYVGSRTLEWTNEGIGNYWSDNAAVDLNADGIGDTAYRPNDLVDELLWVHPVAKLLLASPAIQTLRWAQAQFPAIQPGGIIDTAPLMAPPAMVTHDGDAG